MSTEERRIGEQVQLQSRIPERVPYLRAAKGLQLKLGREVEVRILPAGSSEESAARYVTERDQLARLDHPSFLPVVGELTLRGCPSYLVPLRSHPTLNQMNYGEGTSIESRCQAIRSLAGAVSAAHSAGILLGPVPPERIGWDEDAGVAYFLHHTTAPEDWREDFLKHTPYEGATSSPGKTADIFYWGLLAFWLLSKGQHPYGAGPKNLRPLRGLEPEVSPNLSILIEASLAWDPGQRCAGGPELKAVLGLDRTNLASDSPDTQADLNATVDLAQISSEVLDRVDLLRAAGKIRTRPSQVFQIPKKGSGPREDATLLDEIAGVPEDQPAPTGGIVRYLVVAALLGALALAGLRLRERVPASPARGESVAAPRKTEAALARPGHSPVEVREFLSHQQEVQPEDFPALFRQLQSLVVTKKLPSGENDGKRLMRMWIRYKRDPKGAAKELGAWIQALRKRVG